MLTFTLVAIKRDFDDDRRTLPRKAPETNRSALSIHAHSKSVIFDLNIQILRFSGANRAEADVNSIRLSEFGGKLPGILIVFPAVMSCRHALSR